MPSPTLAACRHFEDAHSEQWQVITHGSFDLLFSNNDLEHPFLCQYI